MMMTMKGIVIIIKSRFIITSLFSYFLTVERERKRENMAKFTFPKKLLGVSKAKKAAATPKKRGGGGAQKLTAASANVKSRGVGDVTDKKPFSLSYSSSKQAKLHHRSLISAGHLLSGGRSGSGYGPKGSRTRDPVQAHLESEQDLTSWNHLKPGTTVAPDFVPDPLKKLIAAGTAIVTLIEGVPSIVEGAAQGEGITYPGSNYIGPFNKLDEQGSAPPNSQMDYLARIHDYQYGQLEAQGVNPYFTFNEADRYMLAHADLTTPEGWAIYVGIGLKQIFPDDYTSVDPVPPYGGRGETSPTSSYQEMRGWETRNILRAEMMDRLQQVGEQLSKEAYQQATSQMTSPLGKPLKGTGGSFLNIKEQGQHLMQSNPFISSLLAQLPQTAETVFKEIGGGSTATTPTTSPMPRTEQVKNQRRAAAARDLGKDPFTRRFLLGGSTTETVPGGRSAIAHRSLLNALRSRSSALPFLSTSRAASFSSAQGNVVSSSMRTKNKSTIQAMHGKQTMRNYKQNTYQPPPQQHQLSQGGLSVPSFVRR
jgi:hypothetical protein